MFIDHEQFKTKLRRAWVKRLYADYANICFQHRLSLKTPLIEVCDSTLLGSWNSKTRVLSLSSALIENHPWHIVTEVLKHEMAHQIVTDVFEVSELHGEHFRKACDILGVDSAFARATTDIELAKADWRKEVVSSDEQRILNRVEKLLSLAQSSNEHEAWLATQRVREILARYNLDEHLNQTASGYVYLILPLGKLRMSSAEKMICSILTSYFFVSVVLSRGFDAKAGLDEQCIELYGKRTNVLMAEYVFHFLRQQCESLWKSFKKTNPHANRLSYQTGLMLGFREKLERENKEWKAREQGAALVLAKSGDNDPALRDFVARRIPRISRRSSSQSNVHSDSFEAGKQKGKSISIHRGIEKSAPQSGALRLLT